MQLRFMSVALAVQRKSIVPKPFRIKKVCEIFIFYAFYCIFTKRLWSKSWSVDLDPQEFGFVHPRFRNKAVSAMLDGHAEVLSVSEMQDMRHWSNLADNPG